jgi:hypothetical protein
MTFVLKAGTASACPVQRRWRDHRQFEQDGANEEMQATFEFV